MSERTEGETTVSDPDTLAKFAAVAADLATSTGHPYHEIYESLVDALGCLAEAERRGAERGWNFGVGEGVRFAEQLVLNPHATAPVNPYRTGDDQ